MEGESEMANKVFQGVLHQMKDVIEITAGIINGEGVVISSTEVAMIGQVHEGLSEWLVTQELSCAKEGILYQRFASGQGDVFAVFVRDEGEHASKTLALLTCSFQNILQYHDEKFDKSNFIKNVVLENILPGDIFAKARELRFATDVVRVVLLVRVVGGTQVSAFEVVSGLFPDKQKDFVFNSSETDTVLVKEIRRGIDEKDVKKLAASIVDTLNGEHYIKAVVGIGTPIGNIKDLAASFKEAQIALEVGKVFDTDEQTISYNHLGIARLIYQLPTTLCEMFLKEVFCQGGIDSLDEETLFTIQRFFENNLNVSETSRGLFVHRNTLVYRLEKIKKLTGLDLREFDDAIVFKVALMVKKYLNSNSARY